MVGELVVANEESLAELLDHLGDECGAVECGRSWLEGVVVREVGEVGEIGEVGVGREIGLVGVGGGEVESEWRRGSRSQLNGG